MTDETSTVTESKSVKSENILPKVEFPDVIGQSKAVQKLGLAVLIQNKTGVFRPTFITGQRGGGKNQLATAVAKHLKPRGFSIRHKNIVEINCASIEDENQFFDQVVDQFIVGRESTIILDEFHALAKTKLMESFLSIWNPGKIESLITKYSHNGVEYTFDISQTSWIALTSEPHKIPDTILTRLKAIQLEDLTLDELGQIIGRNLKKVDIEDGLLNTIATYGRGNGRESHLLGIEIADYLSLLNINQLNSSNWSKIKSALGLRDMGVNNIEHKILKYLNSNGASSLTKLSSALQLTSSATRGSFEKYLLANNLISIEMQKGRAITNRGRLLLESNPE